MWPGAPLEDCLINEVLIYEYHQAYSLDACLTRRGLPGKDDEALIQKLAARFGGAKTRKVQMRNFWRLPGDSAAAWDYATGDVLGTFGSGRCSRTRSPGRRAGTHAGDGTPARM